MQQLLCQQGVRAHVKRRNSALWTKRGKFAEFVEEVKTVRIAFFKQAAQTLRESNVSVIETDLLLSSRRQQKNARRLLIRLLHLRFSRMHYEVFFI